MKRGRNSSGFTLLEVLVGLVLFSIIAYTVNSALVSGSRSWEHEQVASAQSRDFWLYAEFVRKLVAGALPVLAREAGEVKSVAFNGDPRSVTFVVEIGSFAVVGGLYQIEIGARQDELGEHVVVTRQLLHPDAENGGGELFDSQSTLLRDIESLEFEYFGSPRGRDPRVWQARWLQAERLPELVRIKLKAAGNPTVPEITVRLRVTDDLVGEFNDSTAQLATTLFGATIMGQR